MANQRPPTCGAPLQSYRSRPRKAASAPSAASLVAAASAPEQKKRMAYKKRKSKILSSGSARMRFANASAIT
jgi:hypothetical protein